MTLVEVVISGQKFQGDFLKPDEVEKYENSIDQAARIASTEVEGESGSQGIRRQCDAICHCIDEVLGEGSAQRLMPKGPDLLTCLDIFEELCYMYERQITPLIQRRTMKYSALRANRNAGFSG